MNKLILVCLLSVIVLAGARTAPRTHSDFYSAPNDQFLVGYFLDWGHGPFDPTVPSGGLSRVNDLDLIYFSFITTTYDVNIVWGGHGYADGDLVEGYFAFNNCTMYSPGKFELSFCSQWNANGFCGSDGIECPSQNPKGGWCASERFNPITAQCIQKNQPFGISVGGWSDTIDTCEDYECGTTLANNIVAFVNGMNNVCGTEAITAIDFDFEHFSTTNSSQQRLNRISAYAKLIITIRQQLPNIILSYTTRFNAFLNYSQGGVAFASNMEGVTIAQAFTSLGQNIAQVFTFVNIMAYDTPPSNISPDGWVISAYEKILQSFDTRYGGIFAPSQIVIGIETGQQAAGGIYPGYERTMCLANYVYQNNYKGISIWAPNQFTYRYKDQDNQVACNFTNGFNSTAWEMGWPSGSDPKNPNCQAYPINTASPQFNPAMASCIENVGPFMASQIKQVFDGTLQVPSSYCSAPAWNPCGMCKNGTVLKGETCVPICTAPQVYDPTTNSCQCSVSGQQLVNGQCSCPSNQVVVNNTCGCAAGQVLKDGSCQPLCSANQVFNPTTNTCCQTGQQIINGQCQCPSNQVIVNNACGCTPGNVLQDGSCQPMCTSPQVYNPTTNTCCQTGQQLVNGQCQCPSNQVLVNNVCGCAAGQVLKDGSCQPMCNSQQTYNPTTNSCQCNIQGQTIVNGQCQCPGTQVVSGNSCVEPVVCPANTYKVPAGQTCPANQALTKYPGCCCDSQYYADNSVGTCFARHPTCNCTQWMVTEQGIFYGIPVSWCYTDCYAPDSFPIGLHIACSPFLYQTYPNGTTILTNQPNTNQQFCGCTNQPNEIGTLGNCNKPPAAPTTMQTE